MGNIGDKKIAVMGAGNGGHALAADLALRGFDVSLFELPRFGSNIEAARRAGGIWLTGVAGEGFARVPVITTSAEEAIAGRDIVLVAVPAFGVEEFAAVLAPHLRSNHMVVFISSSSMASLRFRRKVTEAGGKDGFRVGETATLTYACRMVEPGKVAIFLRAQNVFFSAYPARDTAPMMEALKEVLPTLRPATSILETCLQNGNPVVHPGPTVLNAGRIEYSGGEFFLYKEGITRSVARVVEAIDRERLSLCAALGIKGLSIREGSVARGYCEPRDELHVQYNESKVFSQIKGPSSLEARYITEDVPYGLVLWSSLGRSLGVRTPTIDAVVHLASVLLGRDFFGEGLTLEKLGLAGLSRDELVRALA